MDKLEKYEKAILDILNEYAKIKYANVTGGNELIADKENHRYQRWSPSAGKEIALYTTALCNSTSSMAKSGCNKT